MNTHVPHIYPKLTILYTHKNPYIPINTHIYLCIPISTYLKRIHNHSNNNNNNKWVYFYTAHGASGEVIFGNIWVRGLYGSPMVLVLVVIENSLECRYGRPSVGLRVCKIDVKLLSFSSDLRASTTFNGNISLFSGCFVALNAYLKHLSFLLLLRLISH